jgi:galacturan 1,4-alpha-galacturonidase
MIRKHILSCICSALFLSAAAQTSTPTESPTPTTASNYACTTYFIKNFGMGTECTAFPGVSVNDDDAAAIQEAFDEAARIGGFKTTIVIPENSTFTIRSEIEFADCRNCQINLNGKLNIVGTVKNWNNAIISVRNMTQFTLDGSGGSGIIDASDFHFNHSTANPQSLFSFLDTSDVVVYSLSLKNAPGTYIRVHGQGNYQVGQISLTTEKGYGRPDTYGVVLSDVQNVIMSDLNVQFEEDQRTGNCIAIDGVQPERGGIYLSNIVCNNTHTGVTVMPGSSGTYAGNDTISVTTVSAENLVVNADIATGFLNAGFSNVNVSDVTFNNITVQGGEGVEFSNCWQLPGKEQPCKTGSGEGHVSQSYTDILLENYEGDLGPPPQNQTGDVTIEVQVVNWGQTS